MFKTKQDAINSWNPKSRDTAYQVIVETDGGSFISYQMSSKKEVFEKIADWTQPGGCLHGVSIEVIPHKTIAIDKKINLEREQRRLESQSRFDAEVKEVIDGETDEWISSKEALRRYG